MDALTWVGVLLCLSQSALFSGLNIGLFSLDRLELEVAARQGDPRARRVQAVRQRANFALATILWGNVSVNVLLALLTGSVLGGVTAFVFSTVVITVFAEIGPQAYFTRHALALVARLAPWLRVYQLLLWPVARPTAWALDWWLGGEQVRYIRERDLRSLIQFHIDASHSEIAAVEGRGALNFLAIDDLPLEAEGEALQPASVIELPFVGDRPVFPPLTGGWASPFVRAVAASGRSWVVFTDGAGEPRQAMRAEHWLRQAATTPVPPDPQAFCCTPVVVRDPKQTLGSLLPRFRARTRQAGDDRVDDNLILLWTSHPRIVTGTDILGRLMRGIADGPSLPAATAPAAPERSW